jgi:radical SAM/Cys-rich protein
MQKLNQLGYGVDENLRLNLVYNPGGGTLPPEQGDLESAYRTELESRWGIKFTNLLTITNMDIGRFKTQLGGRAKRDGYQASLEASFNPSTVPGLMCRHQIEVGWDGTLFDCDFNLALKLPVNHGAPNHIDHFDMDLLNGRRVVTADHCFGCTAGCGSSCAGALA